MPVDHYRRRAESLLRQAAETDDMAARGRLIDEAIHWHNQALAAAGHAATAVNDDVESEIDAAKPEAG